MELFDVNIYVNAFVSDSPYHAICFEFLKKTVESGRNFGYSPLALSGFVRIVTHPKVFSTPASVGDALDFTVSLTDRPNAIPVIPGKTHFTLFSHICRRHDLTGNSIPDAFLAALAIESDCTWVTLDSGFTRFEDLRLKLVS